MQGKGVAGETHIVWSDLMTFKRTFTDPVPEKNEQRYAEKGIDTYHGHARFTGPNTVAVEGGESLEAKHIAIASRAEPVSLGIPGEEHLVNNESFCRSKGSPSASFLLAGVTLLQSFRILPLALAPKSQFFRTPSKCLRSSTQTWLSG